jgi:hypothetical protein
MRSQIADVRSYGIADRSALLVVPLDDAARVNADRPTPALLE